MADEKTNLPAVQEVAPKQVRQYQSVEERVAVFDTARYEHMARIAKMMAVGQMIPASLMTGKDAEGEFMLPEEVIVSRCFMITNFAFNNHADPFAVAQHASFVHGRLCWEGKLIQSILEERHNIRLKYTWNDKTGDAFGVRVTGLVDGKEEWVDGTVGQWKTSHKGSPWANPANHRKQLAYRGAREWARMFKPSVMTGILTDDEVQESTDWRSGHDVRQIAAEPQVSRGAALVQRLTEGKVATTGFSAEHVRAEVSGEGSTIPAERLVATTMTREELKERVVGSTAEETTGGLSLAEVKALAPDAEISTIDMPADAKALAEAGESQASDPGEDAPWEPEGGAGDAAQGDDDGFPGDTTTSTEAERKPDGPRYFVDRRAGGYLIVQPGDVIPDAEEVDMEEFEAFKEKVDAAAAEDAKKKTAETPPKGSKAKASMTPEERAEKAKTMDEYLTNAEMVFAAFSPEDYPKAHAFWNGGIKIRNMIADKDRAATGEELALFRSRLAKLKEGFAKLPNP